MKKNNLKNKTKYNSSVNCKCTSNTICNKFNRSDQYNFIEKVLIENDNTILL